MKTRIVKLSALLVLLFFVASCEKEELSTEGDALQSSANAEGLMSELDDDASLRLAGEAAGDDCPSISYANPAGTFPNTISFDFGSDGCTDSQGRLRRGKITLEISAPYSTEGSVRHFSTEAYSVNDWAIQGDRTVTNQGLNDLDQMYWTVEVANAQVTDPDGQIASWEASRVRTLIEGTGNDECSDDVYQITGGSSGVSRQGVAFQAVITVPLIKPMACRWVVSGVRQVSSLSTDRTRSLDFGNGECDNEAVLTLPNGNQRTVTLRR